MYRVEEISVAYGGVRAVDHVSLRVEANEVVGLVGPNGCGKSSLLNALTGLARCSGTAELDTVPIALRSAVAVHRSGIARVFQAPQIYLAMSTLENVMLTAVPTRRDGVVLPIVAPALIWRDERRRRDVALDALARVGCAGISGQPAERLSYGQRRLVELARALVSDPRVLLLDEPSAGLNEAETDDLQLILSHLRGQGLAILVVEHKISFLDALCDRIVFMEQGRVVAEGTPEMLWSDQRVIDAYLGAPGATPVTGGSDPHPSEPTSEVAE